MSLCHISRWTILSQEFGDKSSDLWSVFRFSFYPPLFRPALRPETGFVKILVFLSKVWDSLKSVSTFLLNPVLWLLKTGQGPCVWFLFICLFVWMLYCVLQSCRCILTLRRLMSYIYIYICIYMEHPFLMFLHHTQRRSTVGRTPDEWSARRRDLYLTTHDTHNRQISMPPEGFEPKISAGERPQAAHLLRSCKNATFGG